MVAFSTAHCRVVAVLWYDYGSLYYYSEPAICLAAADLRTVSSPVVLNDIATYLTTAVSWSATYAPNSDSAVCEGVRALCHAACRLDDFALWTKAAISIGNRHTNLGLAVLTPPDLLEAIKQFGLEKTKPRCVPHSDITSYTIL